MAKKFPTVVGQDQQVELLNGKKLRYVNLDNAASTPSMSAVLDAVNDFMPYYASVHRGSGFKSRYSTKMYEDARAEILSFFGGNEEDHVVVFGMNTSEAVNKLAYRLQLNKDDVVLISMLEHHSNDLPWRSKANVVRIQSTTDGRVDMNYLQELIDEYGSRIKLVAVTGASNVTGHISDIDAIALMTHAIDAQLMVDGAQLAPHRAVSMKRLSDDKHIDYLAVSGHKMYAPFGTGALIARKDTLNKGAPEYAGGGTIEFVSLDEVVWSKAPERDEVGSPNVVGAVAFGEACRQLTAIGMDAVAEHELKLLRYAVEQLNSIPEITLYGATDEASLPMRTGVITLTLKDMNHALVAEILAAEHGVGVRSGCFCAHPYVVELLDIDEKELQELKNRRLSDIKEPIPGMVRMSFGIYSSTDDVDRFVHGIKAIVAGDYADGYEFNQQSGVYEIPSWPKL